MASPLASFTSTIDGVWLTPHYSSGAVASGYEAWIGAPSSDLEAEISMDEFTIFNRREELSQEGAFHLDRGIIEGLLLDRNGQTADTWLNRLIYLVENQRNFGFITYASARYNFKVKLKGLSKRPTIAGGRAWSVSINFREVT